MNAQLRARILTALVGVPVIVWAIGWSGPLLFSSLVAAAVLVSLWEYYRIVFPAAVKDQVIGALAGVVLAAALLLNDSTAIAPWLAGIAVLLFSANLFCGGALAERFNRLGWMVIGTVYIGFLLPHMALVYRLHDGRRWIFFTLLVVMIGDTAAYFV